MIREFKESDLDEMMEIWNEVVSRGDAFPQDKPLDKDGAMELFSSQSFTGVFVEDGSVHGVYILHPNNIGRCGHISNASYSVRSGQRGKRIGERLVRHSMSKAKELGFRILQFNAVTVENRGALHLYKKLGFSRLGTIPGGFHRKDGDYIDIIPHYIEL